MRLRRSRPADLDDAGPCLRHRQRLRWTTLRWTARTIQLVVAPAPGDLNAALLRATERAAARWSTATGLTISVRADPHAPLQVSEDGRSTVLLRTRRWYPDDPAQACYDPAHGRRVELTDDELLAARCATQHERRPCDGALTCSGRRTRFMV
jgi:hypothetical protein